MVPCQALAAERTFSEGSPPLAPFITSTLLRRSSVAFGSSCNMVHTTVQLLRLGAYQPGFCCFHSSKRHDRIPLWGILTLYGFFPPNMKLLKSERVIFIGSMDLSVVVLEI